MVSIFHIQIIWADDVFRNVSSNDAYYTRDTCWSTWATILNFVYSKWQSFICFLCNLNFKSYFMYCIWHILIKSLFYFVICLFYKVLDPIGISPISFTVYLDGDTLESPLHVGDLFECKNSRYSFDDIEVDVEICQNRKVLQYLRLRINHVVCNGNGTIRLVENSRYIVRARLVVHKVNSIKHDVGIDYRNVFIVTGKCFCTSFGRRDIRILIFVLFLALRLLYFTLSFK